MTDPISDTSDQSRRSERAVLLVLSSTYPRWMDDPEPGFVHELSKRLTDRFRVVVVCPHAAGAKRRETMDGVEIFRYRYAPDRWELLVNNGGIVTNLRRNKWLLLLVPSFVLAQVMQALLLAWTQRIRLVHAHWLVPQGWVAALLGVCLPRVRFVVTSHGADLFALKGAVMVGMKRFVLRHAAAITVVSEAMRRTVAGLVGTKCTIEVIPMGVDLEQRFKPDANVTRSTDEILFVGRLVEKKGLRHLLDAMPAILSVRPQARLTIAGFGPEEPALRRQATALGLDSRIDFIGAVSQSELPSLYRRAAVFVAPFVQAESGDQEGLGLVVVEAIGCGCPVVVGDVPAAADLPVRPVQVDADSLAKAVCAILLAAPQENRDELERAREQCVRRFGWDSTADRYGRLLESSMAGDGIA